MKREASPCEELQFDYPREAPEEGRLFRNGTIYGRA